MSTTVKIHPFLLSEMKSTTYLNLAKGNRIPSFPSLEGDIGKLCHSLSDLLYGFSFIINLQAAVAQVKFSTNSSLRG
jgi:hypothetical protein